MTWKWRIGFYALCMFVMHVICYLGKDTELVHHWWSLPVWSSIAISLTYVVVGTRWLFGQDHHE